jgi:hypothetical protein
MARIVAQVTVSNVSCPNKAIGFSALVDTVAAYITLPNAWRERLGEVEELAEIEVEMTDQSVRKGVICGPVRVCIEQFRPIMAEVLFLDMQPDGAGEYEPVLGHIALEQAGAAVDARGRRLVHVKRVDLR